MASGTQAASGSFKRIFNNYNSNDSGMQNRPQKPAVKCGWLFKQGGVIKSWHRRWFIIKGDQLFYYTNPEETKQLGVILLPGNKVVELPLNPNDAEKFPFEIQPGERKFCKLFVRTGSQILSPCWRCLWNKRNWNKRLVPRYFCWSFYSDDFSFPCRIGQEQSDTNPRNILIASRQWRRKKILGSGDQESYVWIKGRR